MSPRPDLGPPPRLGYAGSLLERAAERRCDAEFLTACEAESRAGAYAIGGELIVCHKGENGLDPLFAPAQARTLAPCVETIFLGLHDGAGRFGIGLDPAATAELKSRDDLVVTDLRSIAVQGLVAAEHLAPLAEAKAMLHWHARHRFCAKCGAATQVIDAGWRRDCPG